MGSAGKVQRLRCPTNRQAVPHAGKPHRRDHPAQGAVSGCERRGAMTARHRMIVALVFSLATLDRRSVLHGQAPSQEAEPTTKGLVRKGKVPVSNDILKIKLPRPSEATLSNGLRLIVLEDHRLPQISFSLQIPGAGSYLDPEDQPGLAGFTAALMREGTTTRSSTQISQQLELLAASLNVSAGSSTEAILSGSCISDQAV